MSQWLWTEMVIIVRPYLGKSIKGPIRDWYVLLIGGARWTAGHGAGSQQRRLLTLSSAIDLLWSWESQIVAFCHSFPTVFFFRSFLSFFLFRQWAVWEKEMPLVMYIQHLSEWESYHKTNNRSEKSVHRALFFPLLADSIFSVYPWKYRTDNNGASFILHRMQYYAWVNCHYYFFNRQLASLWISKAG